MRAMRSETVCPTGLHVPHNNKTLGMSMPVLRAILQRTNLFDAGSLRPFQHKAEKYSKLQRISPNHPQIAG